MQNRNPKMLKIALDVDGFIHFAEIKIQSFRLTNCWYSALLKLYTTGKQQRGKRGKNSKVLPNWDS